MIDIDNLSKKYRNKTLFSSVKSLLIHCCRRKNFKTFSHHEFSILQHLTLSIQNGEILGIIGPNGTGKSTLAKMIAETLQPTSGSIKKQGQVVPFLELGVAFNPELTGQDNFYLNGTLLNLSLSYLRKNKQKIFEFAGVQDFMQVPLKYYSSGMQLKLAFSIAMHAEGDIYIFDEILAVGDAAFREKCLSSFQKILDQKKTILIVSHDIPFLTNTAHRILYIEAGLHLLLDDRTVFKTFTKFEDFQQFVRSSLQHANKN